MQSPQPVSAERESQLGQISAEGETREQLCDYSVHTHDSDLTRLGIANEFCDSDSERPAECEPRTGSDDTVAERGNNAPEILPPPSNNNNNNNNLEQQQKLLIEKYLQSYLPTVSSDSMGASAVTSQLHQLQLQQEQHKQMQQFVHYLQSAMLQLAVASAANNSSPNPLQHHPTANSNLFNTYYWFLQNVRHFWVLEK